MPGYQALCEKLGDLAFKQGAYAGAAKKYLDAGNKIKVERYPLKGIINII